jgi:hypothetical protein
MKRHASMNRIYRFVWNHVLDAWGPVAETARGRSKDSRKRKLFAAAITQSSDNIYCHAGCQNRLGSGVAENRHGVFSLLSVRVSFIYKSLTL